MSNRARFVGRSGEKRFSALCSDEGITCNPASEDDHGWDHVIEFPQRSEKDVPADLQKALPAVFVQTKTYNSKNGSIRMKLSNALSLSRSPNPCFIVVPPDADGDQSKPWHAIHFWEQLMGQTLKRAREAARDGIPEHRFSRKFITFRLSKGNECKSSEVLNWIEQTVRSAGPSYAAEKKRLLETVGFDAERLVGTIQFKANSVNELIDHQLGLIQSVPIGRFELRDRRFGIEIKLPMPTFGEGMGMMQPHPKPCRLRLRGPDGIEVELESELIMASLPGLPLEQCKVRVKADFLDLIQSLAGESHLKLAFDTSESRLPSDLWKLTRIITWAGKGKIDLQVWADDKRLFGGIANLDPQPFSQAYERLGLFLDILVSLSSNLRNRPPRVSIEDIDKADDQLVALYGFLTSPDMTVNANIDAGASPGRIDNVITYGFADVGAWRFGALTRWKCTEQAVDGKLWRFVLMGREVVERYAFEKSNVDGMATFRNDFARLSSDPGVLMMDDDAVERLRRPIPGKR